MRVNSFALVLFAVLLSQTSLSIFVRDAVAAGIPVDVHKEMWRLREESPGGKVKALRRLSAMGERAAPAVPLIVELLDSDQRYEAIGDRIANLFSPLATSGAYVSQEAQKALVRIGPPSVGPLIAALRHSRPRVRGNAALTLGEIHDLRAVNPLEDILAHDPDANVRNWSAVALGSMADYWSPQIVEPLVPHLVRALEDESIDVCQHAAYSLGKIKSSEAVPPLIRTLRKRGKNSGAGVALFMITGERFGDRPEKWDEWWEGRQYPENMKKQPQKSLKQQRK
jgi:HEAT repeats/PBS lyase HEAT-like repeat